jgi:vacuolar-type H+-ATPase subunit I/STV1
MKFSNENEIPEGLKEQFIERDGEWLSKDMADTLDNTKRTLNEVDGLRKGNKELADKTSELEAALKAIQEKEQKERESQMSEAEKRDLERERQQTREEELVNRLQTAEDEFNSLKASLAEKEAESIANKIMNKFGPADKFKDAFVKLYKMERMKKIDGTITPTNSKGEAVDLDYELIATGLGEDPLFAAMKAASKATPSITSGGHQEKSGVKVPENTKYTDMSTVQKVAYLKQKNGTQ